MEWIEWLVLLLGFFAFGWFVAAFLAVFGGWYDK